MTLHDPQIPDWFTTLIRQGLTTLYALCLQGCPAADATKATGALWVRLLWEKSRNSWNREHDEGRILAAFQSMALDLRHWPAPAVFFDHLPPREPIRIKPGQKLDAQWGRERQAEALSCMVRQFADLGLDRNGNRIGEPPSKAKTVANMEQLRALYGDGGTDRKTAAAGGDW